MYPKLERRKRTDNKKQDVKYMYIVRCKSMKWNLTAYLELHERVIGRLDDAGDVANDRWMSSVVSLAYVAATAVLDSEQEWEDIHKLW